jgi:hypothetical protein
MDGYTRNCVVNMVNVERNAASSANVFCDCDWQFFIDVIIAQKYRCASCGADGFLYIDHIEPPELGKGAHVCENIRAVCVHCKAERRALLRGQLDAKFLEETVPADFRDVFRRWYEQQLRRRSGSSCSPANNR